MVMSIIIRLQNLPWTANSVDIRKFFSGLSIPDGGVHIVGGEKGDAFIAFKTDEDARQAMSRDGGIIREVPIKLLLSSKNEMQSVVDQARMAVQAAAAAKMNLSSNPSPNVPFKSEASSVTQTAQPNVYQPPPSQLRPTNQGSASQTIGGQAFSGLKRPRSPSPNGGQRASGGGDPLANRTSIGLTPMGGLQPVMNNQPTIDATLGWSRRTPSDFGVAANQGNGLPPPNLNDLNGAARRQISQQMGLPIPGQFQGGQQQFWRIELRGLPFSVTPKDIQEFFRSGIMMFIPDDHIRILVDDRGFTTGGAVVRVTSLQDMHQALTLNGKVMAGRRIDVMPLADSEIGAPVTGPIHVAGPINGNQQPPIGQGGPPVGGVQRDFVVYMKGIPFNACTDQDVQGFFSQQRITEIVFEMDRRTSKPAGNAFVEFPTKEDYEGALELNLRHMGRRYIEVFPTTRDDMEEARRIATSILAEKATFCIHVTGLPPTTTNADLTSYFKGIGAVPFAIHIMLKADGLNAGAAFLEFTSLDQQQLAVRKDGDVINGFQISVKDFSFEEMRKIVGRPLNPPVHPGGDSRPNNGFPGGRGGFGDGGRGRGNFRGGMRGRGGPGRMADRGPGPRDPFADGHCVVHASNVPYKATNDDLRVFFSDYAVLPNGIERRLNETGQPTPEARIAFRSSLEAERAVKGMHKKHLLGRQIFLRLAV